MTNPNEFPQNNSVRPEGIEHAIDAVELLVQPGLEGFNAMLGSLGRGDADKETIEKGIHNLSQTDFFKNAGLKLTLAQDILPETPLESSVPSKRTVKIASFATASIVVLGVGVFSLSDSAEKSVPTSTEAESINHEKYIAQRAAVGASAIKIAVAPEKEILPSSLPSPTNVNVYDPKKTVKVSRTDRSRTEAKRVTTTPKTAKPIAAPRSASPKPASPTPKPSPVRLGSGTTYRPSSWDASPTPSPTKSATTAPKASASPTRASTSPKPTTSPR